VRTLGIDLSANPKLTAACLISWERGRGEVEELAIGGERKGGLKDGDLLDLAQRSDKVAIDSPFGWPAEFVLAVSEWAQPGGTWPTVEKAKLRYRATDRFVAARTRRPLSVSSERIASTAWRCARLLSALEDRTGEPMDRAGGGRAVEVYPAASLVAWGLNANRYKGKEHEAAREELLRKFSELLADVAPVSDATTSACAGSDDALDAVVASLTAGAAALPSRFLRRPKSSGSWAASKVGFTSRLKARFRGSAAADQSAPAGARSRSVALVLVVAGQLAQGPDRRAGLLDGQDLNA
jgi:Protein of unknown function (DUF429)